MKPGASQQPPQEPVAPVALVHQIAVGDVDLPAAKREPGLSRVHLDPVMPGE